MAHLYGKWRALRLVTVISIPPSPGLVTYNVPYNASVEITPQIGLSECSQAMKICMIYTYMKEFSHICYDKVTLHFYYYSFISVIVRREAKQTHQFIKALILFYTAITYPRKTLICLADENKKWALSKFCTNSNPIISKYYDFECEFKIHCKSSYITISFLIFYIRCFREINDMREYPDFSVFSSVELNFLLENVRV